MFRIFNETSGTGMFMYLLKKSIEKGYISREEFEPVVKKAYEGIIQKVKMDSNGLINIYDCSSIGIMDDYKMYVTQPKEVNTFAGVTSFILGTLSMEGLYK
jgi:rhamnogalacturonyl hydrolase YesR